MQPLYLETHASGRLTEKARLALGRMASCTLCPRRCGVNRLNNETGTCKTSRFARVASSQPHFGEEAPLVGAHGSGTIFFSYCNLLCTFCQNYDISHSPVGRQIMEHELADIMLNIQAQGCANINLVSPSHVVAQILGALEIAVPRGLNKPLVYNTGGYDAIETLQLLEGVVDIYMPDFKFWDTSIAEQTCQAPDYAEVARRAILEMQRQVGNLTMDEQGLAQRGLLVRHLVLPNGLAGTEKIVNFLAHEVSPDCYVNVMGQYRPRRPTDQTPDLNRRPTDEECQAAKKAAKDAGLRLDQPRRRMFFSELEDTATR